MSIKTVLVAGALTAVFGSAVAQQVGTSQPEVHPPLNVATCSKSGGCTSQKRSVVLDANWRWVHNVGGFTNCYSGNQWNSQYCPDGASCAKNCALEGATYESTYGVTTSGTSLRLKYVQGNNVGSRMYLMDSTDGKYEMLKLKNKEFSFDVDLSTLPCGLNGALYLSEMPADGGLSSTNVAGAKYGTGYCDAQCARDIKFINGVANVEGWTTVDENSGNGATGACCAEMDIWEANKISSAYTPHPCTKPGLYACKGVECGVGSDRYNGVCDKDGCDFNAWRQGNKTFYGPSMNVDTTKPFTVVTQFLTADGTDTGDLSEIRRFYVQGGTTIPLPPTVFPELNGANSITDGYCTAQKTLFGDTNDFAKKGGLKEMGEAMERGMVLVLSIWDDVTVNMLWLDSVAYPTTGDPNKPGISRGSCATNSGEPKATRAANPNAYVTYSNIKWGELGSTNNVDPYCSSTPSRQCSGSSTTTSRPSTSTTTTSRATTTTSAATTTTRPVTTTTTAASPSPSPPSGGNCSTKWSQCGGINWAGPTCCVSGTTCTKLNDYYFQCL